MLGNPSQVKLPRLSFQSHAPSPCATPPPPGGTITPSYRVGDGGPERRGARLRSYSGSLVLAQRPPPCFLPLDLSPNSFPSHLSAIFHLRIFENTHACGWFLGHRALLVPWELRGAGGGALWPGLPGLSLADNISRGVQSDFEHKNAPNLLEHFLQTWFPVM